MSDSIRSLGRADIEEAAARLKGRVHRTPLLTSRSLSEHAGRPVYLKAENLQKAGSFKARGAFNRALTLSEDERSRGLITYSSGNHGQAVAYVARELGLSALIVVPEDAPPAKIAACRGYGAEVELAGTTSDHRRARALEIVEQRGLALIQPFDDPMIIAGQGSCGLEILEQLPEVGTIAVPIGGGGLVAGILAAVRPAVRVIGVEPRAACAMKNSLAAGRPVQTEPGPTIADGLKPTRPGNWNLKHAVELGLKVVTVEDAAIEEAMRRLFERARLVVEPSGAATTAALLAGSIPGDDPLVLVLSGGNVDPLLFARVLSP